MGAHKLAWEDAMHDDEPRDQNADTAVVPHGYWSMGPEADGTWGLTLVVQDAALDLVFEWQWRCATEAETKHAAQQVESRGCIGSQVTWQAWKDAHPEAFRED